MSFWRLFYHVVWGTKGRAPVLDGELVSILEKSVEATANDMGLIVYAVGVMPEHVHLVVGIPPRHSIADVMQRLKGSSSHLMGTYSKKRDDIQWIGWQGEYGVMSFGERSLEPILEYVRHQPERHRADDLWDSFERLGDIESPG